MIPFKQRNCPTNDLFSNILLMWYVSKFIGVYNVILAKGSINELVKVIVEYFQFFMHGDCRISSSLMIVSIASIMILL